MSMRSTVSMIGTRQARPPNTTRKPTSEPSSRRCLRPAKITISCGRQMIRNCLTKPSRIRTPTAAPRAATGSPSSSPRSRSLMSPPFSSAMGSPTDRGQRGRAALHQRHRAAHADHQGGLARRPARLRSRSRRSRSVLTPPMDSRTLPRIPFSDRQQDAALRAPRARRCCPAARPAAGPAPAARAPTGSRSPAPPRPATKGVASAEPAAEGQRRPAQPEEGQGEGPEAQAEERQLAVLGVAAWSASPPGRGRRRARRRRRRRRRPPWPSPPSVAVPPEDRRPQEHASEEQASQIDRQHRCPQLLFAMTPWDSTPVHDNRATLVRHLGT